MIMQSSIIKKFQSLPRAEQNRLLQEIYNYSSDMKLFLRSKLGLDTDFDELVKRMEKETFGKIYHRKGAPGIPNGRVVGGILTKAYKSNAPLSVLLDLERLAFRGFIDFLNEFGGGPDNFEDMAYRHLENYLKLVKDKVHDTGEKERRIEETRSYLSKLDNMNTDCIYEAFENVIGTSVDLRKN